jgi:hypothetical protein
MAARFFRKLGSGAQRFFGKVASDAPRILGKISNTLSDGGTILRKIENTGKDILGNPLVEAGASMVLGPEAGASMAGASALLNNIGDVSKLSNQASNMTNASTYKGGTNAVSSDILQRAKNLQGNANMIKSNVQNNFV